MIKKKKTNDILDTVKATNSVLINLAYDKYLDDLNVIRYYIFENFKEKYENEWSNKIDSLILSEIASSFTDLEDNNPLNHDKLVCYKLFLCSYLNPFWEFKYPSLYRYYSYKLKQDSSLTVDIFIGKIITLFNTDNDAIYNFIKNMVNEKFDKENIKWKNKK